MRNHIKLITVDLDGTLLNSDHQLSTENKQALEKAMNNGIQVVLATGKTRTSADALRETLGIQTPGVYLQGLNVVDAGGNMLFETTLSPQLAQDVINFAEAQGCYTMAYSGEALLVREPHPSAEEIVKYGEPEPIIVGPVADVVYERHIHKMMFANTADNINRLREDLGNLYPDQLHLTKSAIQELLEVLPVGVSKGGSLARVLEYLDIAPEEMLAIGDGENDIEMLQLAGISVAMANAVDVVKQSADFITRSNDENGVAYAIERIVFNENGSLDLKDKQL